MAVGLVTAIVGCDEKEAGKTVGDGMITIGGLAFTIPHPLGKIIGAVLVCGGSVLKVIIAAGGGEKEEVVLKLTPEEAEKIRKALAASERARVTQPDGRYMEIEVKN
jgi:hypothetical protein